MTKARAVAISIALLLPMFVRAQGRNPSPGSVFAPNNPEVANALDAGTAAFRAGDYEAAKVSFEKAVKLAPSLAVGHLYLVTVIPPHFYRAWKSFVHIPNRGAYAAWVGLETLATAAFIALAVYSMPH